MVIAAEKTMPRAMGSQADPNNAIGLTGEPGEQETHRTSVFVDKVIKMINTGLN